MVFENEGVAGPSVQTAPGAFPSLPSTPQIPIVYHGFFPNGPLTRGVQVGGMSAIRRFFCLFLTFDLLLTSLLWLITLMIAGDFDPSVVFQQQILHYNIKTSLFDTVMISATRFVVLLLFYGVLRMNHWIIVALTTVGTGVVIVAKVLLYDWSDGRGQVMTIMVILTSFILSWAEAWLLDIKVVPYERFASEYFSTPPSVRDERTPLFPKGAASQSHGSFYSPIDSDNESEDRKDGKCNEDDNGYQAKGKEALFSSWSILNEHGWEVVKKLGNGDTISSNKLSNGRRVFKVESRMNVSASQIFSILFDIKDLPKWNPSMESAQILEVIDDFTDISYQISKEVGKGIISSRECVTLRHVGMIEDWRVLASVSITWPKIPSTKSTIRAEVGPSCWAFKPLNESSCELRWLLNTQINGWIPVKVVESTLVDVMAETITQLHIYSSEWRDL